MLGMYLLLLVDLVLCQSVDEKRKFDWIFFFWMKKTMSWLVCVREAPMGTFFVRCSERHLVSIRGDMTAGVFSVSTDNGGTWRNLL